MGSFSYHVGQRIKKYRKSRGYTIEQFSAMINKSKATVSKYENGTITIDVETLYDIARALDIDLKCFIDYQPPVFHAQSVLPKNFYFNQPRAYMYYYDGRVRQLVRSPSCSPGTAHAPPPPLRPSWGWTTSGSRTGASICSPAR